VLTLIEHQANNLCEVMVRNQNVTLVSHYRVIATLTAVFLRKFSLGDINHRNV